MKKGIFISRLSIMIAAVLWLITAVNYFVLENYKNTNNIMTAFANASLLDTSAKVSCQGQLVDMYRDSEQVTALLKMLAEKMSLNDYDIVAVNDGDNLRQILTQKGSNGSAIIEITTLPDNSQYLSVNINLENNIAGAFVYRESVEEAIEQVKIDTVVNLYLVGNARGNLTAEAKDTLADKMLEDMDADIVEANRQDECYTVYAYTKDGGEYVMLNGDKVNVNISMNYNEINDRTYVFLAFPMNNQEF